MRREKMDKGSDRKVGRPHSLSGKEYRAQHMLKDLESGVHFLVNRLCLFQKQTQVELL